MYDPRQPSEWIAPTWHPDWGDAVAELEHLRELALAIAADLPEATFRLEIPEPGLMYLEIQTREDAAVEVYSNAYKDSPTGRTYCLFFSPGCTGGGDEQYAQSTEAARAAILSACR